MSHRRLHLQDRVAVADFIASAMEYLPENDRRPYEKLLRDLEGSDPLPFGRLIEMVKNLGAASWPARRALHTYVTTTGIDAEWEGLLEAVRPTTATILKRLRKASGGISVDETLASSDATTVINEKIGIELELIRPRVQIEVWRRKQKEIKPFVQESVSELEAMRKRLKQLRDQAGKTEGGTQEALLAKLELFEDRIYFSGETIPLETLDEEIQMEAGELEVPANEEPML